MRRALRATFCCSAERSTVSFDCRVAPLRLRRPGTSGFCKRAYCTRTLYNTVRTDTERLYPLPSTPRECNAHLARRAAAMYPEKTATQQSFFAAIATDDRWKTSSPHDVT